MRRVVFDATPPRRGGAKRGGRAGLRIAAVVARPAAFQRAVFARRDRPANDARAGPAAARAGLVGGTPAPRRGRRRHENPRGGDHEGGLGQREQWSAMDRGGSGVRRRCVEGETHAMRRAASRRSRRICRASGQGRLQSAAAPPTHEEHFLEGHLKDTVGCAHGTCRSGTPSKLFTVVL